MKERSGTLGQTYLTSHEMREVVMQTAEPVSTREATKRLVKPLKSTYEKEKIKQVAYNATQLVSKKRTQLLRLLDNF